MHQINTKGLVKVEYISAQKFELIFWNKFIWKNSEKNEVVFE